MSVVFCVDLLVLPGTAVPALYGIVLALFLPLPWHGAVFAAAVGASALTVLAGTLESGLEPTGPALTDRVLSLIAIWVGAWGLGRYQELQETVGQAWRAAERATQSKQRFLSAASHDLRHPVQAGMLFHDLLSRRLYGTPHKDLLDHLGQSLVMMAKGLDALLEVSRLDAGRIRPRPNPVSVADVFDRLLAQFEPLATAAGLQLTAVTSCAIIRSDPELLFQLLQNLVSNAIRYTPRGRILLGCRRYGRFLRLQVLDTGIGIPADSLEVIFEEFHQLRAIPGDSGGGLGLGLAVVERLGHLLGHPVRVRSKHRQGTMFEVIVPIDESHLTRPKAQTNRWPRSGRIPARLAGIAFFFDGWISSDGGNEMGIAADHQQAPPGQIDG